MDWSYIAGLFDGDGCPSIFTSTHKKRKSISPSIGAKIMIITSTPEKFGLLIDFLRKNNIYIKKYGTKQLVIHRQNDVEKFCLNIYPHLMIKNQQIRYTLIFLYLKKQIKECRHSTVMENLDVFDKIRHKLHKYSRKGRKLKRWNF